MPAAEEWLPALCGDAFERAFADPETGVPGQALSAMQGRKLKEITAKAKGEEPKRRWGRKKADD